MMKRARKNATKGSIYRFLSENRRMKSHKAAPWYQRLRIATLYSTVKAWFQ